MHFDNNVSLIYLCNADNSIINNVTMHEGGQRDNGIVIHNSHNTKVVENICEKQASPGIYSVSSNNNFFKENLCIFNSVGISISYSNDNLVQYNQFDWNRFGMLVYKSNLSIINNTINSNEEEGIWMRGCKFSSITANNVSFNSYRRGHGIYALVTDESQFIYNQFINNSNYGLFLDRYSDNNTIHHNRFIYNNIGGESQALDHGKNNTWHDVNTLEGNYWNEWDSRKPYPIIGGADAEDMYPLNESFERISFSTAGVIVSVIIISTLSIILKKKKKKEVK